MKNEIYLITDNFVAITKNKTDIFRKKMLINFMQNNWQRSRPKNNKLLNCKSRLML